MEGFFKRRMFCLIILDFFKKCYIYNLNQIEINGNKPST